MANNKILSVEEEAKLIKPIEEYVQKIQSQIDELRANGTDKVLSLRNTIAVTKADKNFDKEERADIIAKAKAEMVKAKEVEASNKDKVASLVADAES